MKEVVTKIGILFLYLSFGMTGCGDGVTQLHEFDQIDDKVFAQTRLQRTIVQKLKSWKINSLDNYYFAQLVEELLNNKIDLENIYNRTSMSSYEDTKRFTSRTVEHIQRLFNPSQFDYYLQKGANIALTFYQKLYNAAINNPVVQNLSNNSQKILLVAAYALISGVCIYVGWLLVEAAGAALAAANPPGTLLALPGIFLIVIGAYVGLHAVVIGLDLIPLKFTKKLSAWIDYWIIGGANYLMESALSFFTEFVPQIKTVKINLPKELPDALR